MGRKKMFLWIIAAFILVLYGINIAYTANTAMTGFVEVPKPLNYYQQGDSLTLVFLGKKFVVDYPVEKFQFYLTKVYDKLFKVLEWARQETDEFIKTYLVKIKEIKEYIRGYLDK